ncbi:hypothetical protein B9Z65_5703 [Elsinoe australis]|uniref:Uncharacterized protein n=1 Tax=Elsinoe australis TaxID=40998 RepID=A0A2P7YIU5_9PEZI|nr:hypothetical protein B9Z65_5703 [Elsinoe australis]
MASAQGGSFFLPALDECLQRRQAVVSWRDIYISLTDPSTIATRSAIDQVLKDQRIRELLTTPFSAFQKPSSESRAQFGTLTSAVNVPASNSGEYNVTQLKDDASWLSKEVDVDEISALRVTLLAWQEKARRKLLSGWSEEEIVGLRNTTATSSGAALAGLVSRVEDVPRPGTPAAAQDNTEIRRTQLLHVYYREQEYFWKACEAVFGLAQNSDLQVSKADRQDLPPAEFRLSIEPMWKAQIRNGNQTTSPSIVEQISGALRSLVEQGLEQEKWPAQAHRDTELSTTLTRCILERMISLLRILQLHLHTNRGTIKSLSDVTSINPELTHVHDIIYVLVTFVSVDMLRVTPTLDAIDAQFLERPSNPQSDASNRAYFDDPDCLQIVTSTLYAALQVQFPAAGPVALAWAIIAARIDAHASDSDSQLGIEDGRSSPDVRKSALKDSSTKKSRPKMLKEAIQGAVPEGANVIHDMGIHAANTMNALETATAMIHSLSNAFRLPTEIHSIICSRLAFYELNRVTLDFTGYTTQLAESVIEMLRYDLASKSLSASECLALWPTEPAKTLDEDKLIMGPYFMAQVVARYPFELGPFVACLQAPGRSEAYVDEDGSKIARLLENLDTFTCEMPLDWPYDAVEDSEKIVLRAPLPVFSLKRGVPSSFADRIFTIPAGTIGLNMSERNALIVRWDYLHSGLEYLGALLSSYGEHARMELVSRPSDLDDQGVADTLALITTMMRGSLASADIDAPKLLLGQISNGMTRNDDIISVVFGIFEEVLHKQVVKPCNESSISILTQCIDFMKVALHIFPDRVWSQLSRTGLLPLNDSPGAMAAIIGGTEVPMAQFQFLSACVSLYDCLVSDCVHRAVSQEGAVGAKAVTRFAEESTTSNRTPRKMMGTLLFNFGRILIDVLQSQISWRFTNPFQRRAIMGTILRTLDEVLLRSNAPDPKARKLFSVFETAASGISTAYLAESAGGVPIQALIDVFVTAIVELPSVPDPRDNHELVSVTAHALRFSTSLLRIGLAQNKNGATLRKHLLQALPLLARLYAVNDVLKPLVAELLTALVQYANATSEEPPSLLGHLPTEPTRSFLAVVTNIESPLQSLDNEAVIWDMLSAIVSNKQQWLAISLLTGSTPRERLKTSGKHQNTKSRSLIDLALDRLTKISSLPPRRAIAMLAFVAHAQSHWNWVSTTIALHQDFVSFITDWISGLTPNIRQTDTEACTRSANENQMAAFVADILARYLHNIKDSEQQDQARKLLPKLSYLRDYATSVDGYNHSLHKNLLKNFEQKFPSVSLESFKRSNLKPAELGRNYFYDLDLADQVLGFDPSWKRTKGQGFIDEIARANVNFSLVDSQIALLKSWKSLALQICSIAATDAQLQKDMAKVVSGCLKANIDNVVPTQIFENISEIRADFAFAVLQHLNRVKSQDADVKSLFPMAWDMVRTSGLDFEVITEAKTAAYYRTLLQILFLTVQPHAQEPPQEPTKSAKESLTKSASTAAIPLTPLTSSFLEVLNKVIATNFRALCTLVHAATPSSPTLAQPSDFVLLTALLQSIFRVPSTLIIHRQIASTIADTSLIRYATSLYSWSSSLNPTDPIYGEISILILLSLSTIPQTAELIATESVLSSISTATTSAHFRASRPGPASSSTDVRGGKGPFDAPARLHSIWSRGILPLLLNILSAVGPGIAPEIVSFINSFPLQLHRCETELLAPLQPSPREPHRGCITLNLAAEAHSLALLGSIVEGLRQQGAAIGVDAGELESVAFERKMVGEAVEGLLRNRGGLKGRIVPVAEREEGLRRRKGREGESALEDAVVAELKGVVEAAGVI